MDNSLGKTKVLKSVCMLCFQVCGLNAYVKDGKLIKVEGMMEHPFSRGVLCPRGYHLPDYVYSPDRLRHPMKKRDSGWSRVSWDEAIDTIVNKLQQIKNEYGAHSVALSVGSIGAENIEISAFAQRFRAAFGTPNYFSIEAHCFRSRIMARLFTFGTYPLEDPDNSDCIVLWGHNPDASEPPLASRIYQALDRGLKLIAIDPKRIPLASRGIHIQPRPGTDCALALAMMSVIIKENLYDKEFVEKYTTGFDNLVEHVEEYAPEKVSKICKIPADDIRRISRIFAEANSASIIQGINSLDQHINGFQINRALAILHAITGNYDKPGAWCTNPFMRLSDLRLPVDEKPIGADEHPIFHSFWSMTSPYGQQMLLPDVILNEEPYPIKAMIVSGGNPVAAWPDSNKISNAFKKLDMLVVMDLFMSETAKLADIVLPACSSVEKLGLAYNYGLTGGMPFAMLSKKLIEPLGECWPDWKFYSELGRRMGYREYFPWDSDEEVIEHFLEPSGMTLKQLAEDHPEGMWYGERCYDVNAKKQIRTPSGKIELYSQSLADAGEDPMPVHKEPSQSPVQDPELAKRYPLILVAGARIPEYTHWQMKNIPQLRLSAPDPIAEINVGTAREYDVVDGELIIVETNVGQVRVKASVTKDIMPGVVSLTHGWGDESNANNLTKLEPRDSVTGYAEFRNVACRIKKV
jgi:anaerobic selenocysteine-containing dehydrogenase